MRSSEGDEFPYLAAPDHAPLFQKNLASPRPALPDLAKPCPAWPGLTFAPPNHTMPRPATKKPHLKNPRLALPCRTLPGHALPRHAGPCLAPPKPNNFKLPRFLKTSPRPTTPCL